MWCGQPLGLNLKDDTDRAAMLRGRTSSPAAQFLRPRRDPPRHTTHAFGELVCRRDQADHQVVARREVMTPRQATPTSGIS